MSDVVIRNVGHRPLNVAEPDRAAIAKRIYVLIQATKTVEVERFLANARRYEEWLDVKTKISLKMLDEGVRAMLREEEQIFRNANDLGQLNAAGKDILHFRGHNAPLIAAACGSLSKHLNERWKTENARYAFFKDSALLQDLNLCETNVSRAGDAFSWTEWVINLIAETTLE